ncbi:MAG: 16S rRNA (guanine(527)-N(7))-methyltransferase RsmG [Desulfuromonadales bacterium]|nr:16S rRNA (guanine(527)-N(7))-methyltransferase RsmG [Desulfuromonadales bacterium]
MTLAERLDHQQINLSASVVAQLERLAVELQRWNVRYNLTAITDPAEIDEKHLVDSLTLLPLISNGSRLLDIGSGAGFPALPVKIACPDLTVVTVDAVAKKVRFQRHVVRVLGLSDFQAVHGRVETLAGESAYRKRFDLVTARAVTSLPKLVALAEPLLRQEGRLLAMKGPEAQNELLAYGDQLEEKGWVFACHDQILCQSGARRCLVELWRR